MSSQDDTFLDLQWPFIQAGGREGVHTAYGNDVSLVPIVVRDILPEHCEISFFNLDFLWYYVMYL